MIHTYEDNKRWEQNLRRNEGRREIFGLTNEGEQRQQQEGKEPKNFLPKVS